MIYLARRDHRKSKFKRRQGILKANRDLCLDDVRILIFDDPAEEKRSQCPEFPVTQLYSGLQGK